MEKRAYTFIEHIHPPILNVEIEGGQHAKLPYHRVLSNKSNQSISMQWQSHRCSKNETVILEPGIKERQYRKASEQCPTLQLMTER